MSHKYIVSLDSLIHDYIEMKEDLDAFYESLDYEEGFVPFDVNPSVHWKWFLCYEVPHFLPLFIIL